MANNFPVRDTNLVKSFFRHFLRNLTLGFSALILILLIGILGFRYFENEGFINSYANAAMIVSGVGTLTEPKTIPGIIFTATYSIFGGVSFLLIVAIVYAPIFHWLFRKIHVEDREHFKD